MSNNHRVLNITRGFTLKFKQACKAVEECACEWVEHGKTIRDLTLRESIDARNQQAKFRAPIAMAEIPGLRVEGIIQDFGAIRAANQFAHEATR